LKRSRSRWGELREAKTRRGTGLVGEWYKCECKGRVRTDAIALCTGMGLYETVTTLMSKGADINVSDMYGRTALHYTVVYGAIRLQDAVVAMLVKGASMHRIRIEASRFIMRQYGD
jgi:hypothetical protein